MSPKADISRVTGTKYDPGERCCLTRPQSNQSSTGRLLMTNSPFTYAVRAAFHLDGEISMRRLFSHGSPKLGRATQVTPHQCAETEKRTRAFPPRPTILDLTRELVVPGVTIHHQRARQWVFPDYRLRDLG